MGDTVKQDKYMYTVYMYLYMNSGTFILWTPGQSVLIREVSSFQR